MLDLEEEFMSPPIFLPIQPFFNVLLIIIISAVEVILQREYSGTKVHSLLFGYVRLF